MMPWYSIVSPGFWGKFFSFFFKILNCFKLCSIFLFNLIQFLQVSLIFKFHSYFFITFFNFYFDLRNYLVLILVLIFFKSYFNFIRV